jgi:hypothetical protein
MPYTHIDKLLYALNKSKDVDLELKRDGLVNKLREYFEITKATSESLSHLSLY